MPRLTLKILQARIDDQARQIEALREASALTLQGRWTGEMPNAAGLVKSLTTDPEKNNWDPVPFPAPGQL